MHDIQLNTWGSNFTSPTITRFWNADNYTWFVTKKSILSSAPLFDWNILSHSHATILRENCGLWSPGLLCARQSLLHIHSLDLFPWDNFISLDDIVAFAFLMYWEGHVKYIFLNWTFSMIRYDIFLQNWLSNSQIGDIISRM